MTSEELCPKCTLPRDKNGSGSLTQWMTTCSCDREGASKAEDVQFISLNLCKQCGKRADNGRVGSLTQFIFRYDLCSCEGAAFAKQHGITLSKQISDQTNHETADQVAGASDRRVDESQWQQEPEDALAVNQEAFPRERYKPLKLMGKGAEGTVYLCRDRLLNKVVAIKLLNVLTNTQLQSFQLEAKLLSKLDHPNIVRILDFGVTVSGAPYMVLEQTEGVSLDQFLKEHGPLSWRAAATLFLPLSKALSYCHTNGIFHRDLKPGNILLLGNRSWLSQSTYPPDEPAVQLVDFGVAKNVGSEGSKEAMIGTPSFMAPDVARGLSFDARSEIYSLGCTIYTALIGRPPFRGDSATEILLKHTYEQAPLLDGDTYPEELIQTLARCLEKEPSNRIQSMDDLAEELATVAAMAEIPRQSEEDNEVSAAGWIGGQRSKSKKRKIVSSLAIATVCSVGAIAYLATRPVELPSKAPKKLEGGKSVPKQGIDSKDQVIGLEDLMDPALKKVGSWQLDRDSLKIYDEAGCKSILQALDSHPYWHLKLNGWLVPKLPPEMFSDWRKHGKYIAVTLTEGTDEQIAAFAPIERIDDVELWDSPLTGAGLGAFNDAQLKSIYFSHCGQLDTSELSLLKKFTSLEKLTFEEMYIERAKMQLICSLPLTTLSLERSKIEESAYPSLAHLDKIAYLNLADTEFSDRHARYLYGLRNLKKLDLAGCSLSPKTQAELLQRFPKARVMFLHKLRRKKKPL